MLAEILCPVSDNAVPQVGLISIARVYHHVPDLAWSWPRVSRDCGIEGFTTVQLSAHHLGTIQAPRVSTDGAPGTLVKDLHSASTSTASIHQTELSCVWGERGQRHIYTGKEGFSGPVGQPHLGSWAAVCHTWLWFPMAVIRERVEKIEKKHAQRTRKNKQKIIWWVVSEEVLHGSQQS